MKSRPEEANALMLLMKTPRGGAPPPERTLLIPGGGARIFPVVQGQLLTIRDIRGGQVGALFAFTQADIREFMSPHHTRVFGGTFLLRLGTRVVTNRRRPMFVLGRYTVRSHDLLIPASPACLEVVVNTLSAEGLNPPRIPDPVHLFMNVGLDSSGRLHPGPPCSKAGDHLTFRVLIDSICALAACPAANPGWSANPPTELRVEVHNELLVPQIEVLR
jgi:uncharacterized protein YcgI (DUF1989 family)